MNRKRFTIPVLFVATFLLVAFMPLSAGSGKHGDRVMEFLRVDETMLADMTYSEAVAVEVIPVNTTLREALARFSLFYNYSEFSYSLNKNYSRLGYRLAGNMGEWKSVVYYFYGLPLVLDGDVRHQYFASLDLRFGLPDYAPVAPFAPFGEQTHRNPPLVDMDTMPGYDILKDLTRVSWRVTGPGLPTGHVYVEPDAWVPVVGSWLFIDLWIDSETQLDDLRIGLSLYLQK